MSIFTSVLNSLHMEVTQGQSCGLCLSIKPVGLNGKKETGKK